MLARALAALAARGRQVLVAGLAVGVLAPSLAEALVPTIVPCVAALLFLTTVRVGPGAFRLGRRGVRVEAARAAAMQTALPLLGLGAMTAAGWAETPLGLGVLVTLAACPITGSAGLTLLAGADPAPALRVVAVGTAAFPLTVLPVLAAMPQLGEPSAVLGAAGRLLALVGLCGGGGLLLRAAWPAVRRPEAGPVLDGGITFLMAFVVVGLMAAVGPALREAQGALVGTLAAACALNFGLQAAAFLIYRRAGAGEAAPGMAVAAGNRNLALMFAALPPDVAGPMLLWLGVYQVPMYLTPMVMKPLFDLRRSSPAGRP